MIKGFYIKIFGIVQGVGFRPFIYGLAKNYNLCGYVLNNSTNVEIYIEANKTTLNLFLSDISKKKPANAIIEDIKIELCNNIKNIKDFYIKQSQSNNTIIASIAPDSYLCDDCLKELFDKSNRRFEYPFINCINCGPRFSLTNQNPFDRKNTSMNNFQLCEQCNQEYISPDNRRFHSQTNACWKCGPFYEFYNNKRKKITENPILETKKKLKKGNIIAIKGTGGFHLVVDAKNHSAVRKLRKIKNRNEKPFAVMSDSIDKISLFANICLQEKKALLSKERPIVILEKKNNNIISSEISLSLNTIGVMLPYCPIHYLLLKDFVALIFTSANRKNEPLIHTNNKMFRYIEMTDYLLIHNRKIINRCDDSIVKKYNNKITILRRSRSFVPLPIKLNFNAIPIIGCGAHIKNTICIANLSKAYVSQHIGEIESIKSYDYLLETVHNLKKITGIEPEYAAVDLHPHYISSNIANEFNLKKIQVQHHHSHIVSCMVENNIDEDVLGIALDGTGLGTDYCSWGSEIFICNFKTFQRMASFEYLNIPGKDSAIKAPWKIGLSCLCRVYNKIDDFFPFFKNIEKEQILIILKMIKNNVNIHKSSGMGRLFDAVSSIIGLRHYSSYEGQGPIELESIAFHDINDYYQYDWIKNDKYTILISEIIKSVVKDVQNNCPIGLISAKFHNTIINIITNMSTKIAKEYDINKIIMSGGVFQNRIIHDGIYRKLLKNKFNVFSHSKIPTNDGGISLGQVVIGSKKIK